MNLISFIETISDDDNRVSDDKFFDDIENILEVLYLFSEKNKKRSLDIEKEDALDSVVSNVLGMTIRAYIVFSLKVARMNNKKEKDWGKNKYERFLEKNISEAYILFGWYLPQLHYLDYEYTGNKIKELTDNSEKFEKNWEFFMAGYLGGASLYKDLYENQYMRQNYLKALDVDIFNTDRYDLLVYHICVGYLNDVDVLENDGKSLFWKMLINSDIKDKISRWNRVVWYFENISTNKQENLKEEHRKKILKFWEWTYKQKDEIGEILKEGYPPFLETILRLIFLLETIDGEKKGLDYRSSFLSS